MEREALRNPKTYDALIFDPPAFGRGGKGKVWKINKDLPKLMALVPQLLSRDPIFVLITCHDPDWPADKLAKLLEETLVPLRLGGRIEKVCMYLYIYVYVCVGRYLCVWVWVCIYVGRYLCVYVCMCVCMYVYICVYIYICMCVCMHAYMHVFMYSILRLTVGR